MAWSVFRVPGMRAPARNVRFMQLRFASSALAKTLSIAGREVTVPTGLFIGNEFRPALGGNTFGVENPHGRGDCAGGRGERGRCGRGRH